MSDSRKSQNKKISISTISDEVDAQTSNQLNSHEQSSSHFHSTQNDVSSSSHVDFNQSSSSNHNSNDNNGHNSNRQSLKRQSRRSRPSSNEQESITLQETERRPVTLKASFLRRKIKEYEDEDDATTSGATLEDAGKRVIFINQQQPQKYCNNHISTAKYSALSFIPSFLFEQFRRYSNCFFLFIALLQQIPDVSPTGRYTTLVPLIFILSVSAIKEIIEDFKRHRADDETNNREIEKLQNGLWVNVKWRHLAVGDIVKVQNNNFFPADLILLSSSEPQGISFIETSNLDGETNLKIRQGLPDTSKIVEAKDLNQLQGTIESEPPNRHLYEFNGNFKELNRQVQALGPDQVLLRGAMLRNTSWIFGMVIYTGHDTKLMRNSTSAPLKRSTVDKMTNTQILMLFFILIVLCLTSAIFNEIWTLNYFTDHWYLGTKNWTKNFAYNLLTFIILYNNLIPISLQVTLELVRFIQAIFINLDIEMYHEESNTPAMARTSNLNEELGMVKYVFSDKTGTLTRNVMEFKKCSIAGQIYALENEAEETGEISSTSFTTTDGPGPSRLSQHILAEKSDSDVARNFMTLMAICHTVIPENGSSTAHDNVDNASSINVINEDIIYHAASPDERALVYGAKKFGFIFHTRTPAYVEMDALGDTERYDILNVLEFTSTRKRMSIIARNSRGEIKLYCKGADTVIFERLAPDGQDYKDITLRHLEEFASEGLRTLCLAVADIDPEVYEHWKDTYHKASTAIQNRERKVEDAASLIEINLKLLGATAIEDKLQEGVPETIAALLEAKIKLWVLTGDKQETAINIGYSCRLLQQGMDLIIMNEDSLDNTRTSINRHSHDFQAVTSSCSSANNEHFKKDNTALIIDGKTLKYALSCELRREFYELCINCKCVICCRVSPIQKADCIMLVRECSKSKDLWSRNDCVTLAIGDGANDVAMIQRAHVGVGISGVEGLQAACASDYSIAQFKYLRKLLLVHGAWNYSRMCKLILYSFYKNICLYVIELWFAIYSGWSGQILFERWTIGLYNVFFTALPPFAIGIFDKVYSADTLFRNPKIYENFQSARLFNVKVFWIWIGNALIHSIILYWMPMYSYFDGIVWDNGREGGYLVLGNMVYTYVVVTVCLKAGLISNSWTWLTHCAIWGSIALWFLFMLIYSNIWPIIRVGAVFSGMHHMIFTTPAFWFGLFLIPVAALLLDVVIKVIQNRHKTGTTYTPRSSQPRQESKASITIGNNIGKIKEFLGWNRDQYPVNGHRSTENIINEYDETPTRPPRRKRATNRNSVAPSEDSEVKVISSTQIRVNDIETQNDDELEKRHKHESLHM